jgi:haloalkane dehalogenase
VRGVAFFETIVKPVSWDELGDAPRARAEKMRGPEGEKLVLETDFFVRTAFTGGVLAPLGEEDLRPYLEPYPTPESRRPILQWARSMPIGGEPADVHARVERYDAWLAASDSVPKLLITFEGSPTLLITPAVAEWCEEHIANLEIEHGGASGHHAPEDRPDTIAASITAWARRHALLATPAPR